jgi:hypothetical protein
MKQIEDNFIKSFNKLLNKKCWAFHNSVETTISFNFGKKIKRSRPLKTKLRPLIERRYDGEFHLLIFCSWRIESKSKILISSREENGGYYKQGGPTLKALKSLIGSKVTAVEISNPGFDFALTFENDLTFRVFCDTTGKPRNHNDNYVYYTQELLPQAVDVKGKLVVGK